MTSYHNEVIVSTMQDATDTKVCQFIIVISWHTFG